MHDVWYYAIDYMEVRTGIQNCIISDPISLGNV